MLAVVLNLSAAGAGSPTSTQRVQCWWDRVFHFVDTFRHRCCRIRANPALHVSVWCSLLISGFAQCDSVSSRLFKSAHVLSLALLSPVSLSAVAIKSEHLTVSPRRLRRRNAHHATPQPSTAEHDPLRIVLCLAPQLSFFAYFQTTRSLRVVGTRWFSPADAHPGRCQCPSPPLWNS